MATTVTPPVAVVLKRGYRKFASLMSSEKETAIFRRFDRLNMLNLMSLQAELIELEDLFDQTCDEDEASGDPARQAYSVDFNAARQADDLQWTKLVDIRAKLKEYNATLLQLAQVQRLNKPNCQVDIKGLERARWIQIDPATQNDLVAFSSDVHETAPFATWASNSLLDLFHRLFGHKHKRFSKEVNPEAGDGIVRYESTTILKYTKYAVTVLASLLPIVCIVILYEVNSNPWRLGTMAMFTALFAAVLVIFTSAREVEIFGGTAAFAAVEVIFIGSTLTNSTN